MCTDRETLTDFQDLATMLLRTPRIPYHLAPDHTPENRSRLNHVTKWLCALLHQDPSDHFFCLIAKNAPPRP